MNKPFLRFMRTLPKYRELSKFAARSALQLEQKEHHSRNIRPRSKVCSGLFISLRILLAISAIIVSGCSNIPKAIDAHATLSAEYTQIIHNKIPSYNSRFGRQRPIVAVVGHNYDTELTDFVVPYGVLSASGAAEVYAVSTFEGTIKTRTDLGKPAFQIQSEFTIEKFDQKFPEGADYLIVPATHPAPALLEWIAQQSKKGTTIVSICNGAMVVAMSGAMNGRYATAHWSTEDHRLEHLSQIHWIRNIRFVADGNWISSAGVSASMPTSIALVEAIAGSQRARTLANELGIEDWSNNHNSDLFQPQLGVNLTALLQTVYTNEWFHHNDQVGIAVSDEVDEVSLALTVDAYSSTGRSQAFIVSERKSPLKTKHGLVIIPDYQENDKSEFDYLLPEPQTRLGRNTLDKIITEISTRYGKNNAYGVALVLEYPSQSAPETSAATSN